MPPITEQELAEIERRLDTSRLVTYTCAGCGAINRTATDTSRENLIAFRVQDLVTEVRRLRSRLAYHHVTEGVRGVDDDGPGQYCLVCHEHDRLAEVLTGTPEDRS